MGLTVTELGLIAARGLLAATFLVAGVAKLADRTASAQALRDFGAPRVLEPFGVLLPPAEIIAATGLLFAASAWYAAWAAAALLAIFIIGIAANLARGQQPPCNCFGQLHARPISWRTLVRNAVLAACAIWLIVSGPPHAAADLWVFLAGLDSRGRRIALVAAAAIGFLVLHILTKDNKTEETEEEEEEEEEEEAAEPRPRFDAAPARAVASAQGVAAASAPEAPAAPVKTLSGIGLPVGTEAPAFVLPDLAGHPHSLASLLAPGKPVLLVFSSPHCGSCQALAPKLPALAALHAHALQTVLIYGGGADRHRDKLKDAATLLVLLQQDYEVSEDYDSTSTPAAVIVGADGVIQSDLAVGALAIQQLMASRG